MLTSHLILQSMKFLVGAVLGYAVAQLLPLGGIVGKVTGAPQKVISKAGEALPVELPVDLKDTTKALSLSGMVGKVMGSAPKMAAPKPEISVIAAKTDPKEIAAKVSETAGKIVPKETPDTSKVLQRLIFP